MENAIKRIKGAKEYAKFKEGKSLTRKEAMLAQCYDCNGGDESGVDCGATRCPMYQYHPHRNRKVAKRGKSEVSGGIVGASTEPKNER